MKTTYDLIQYYPTGTRFTTNSIAYRVQMNNRQLRKVRTLNYYTYNVLDLFFRYSKLNYLLEVVKGVICEVYV